MVNDLWMLSVWGGGGGGGGSGCAHTLLTQNRTTSSECCAVPAAPKKSNYSVFSIEPLSNVSTGPVGAMYIHS